MLPVSNPAPPASLVCSIAQTHILVVDDDELGCRAVCRLLEQQGYHCQESHSGTEALKTMETACFGLIIADINMEGNTRLEFIQSLRNRETPLPIILITGHPSIETAAAATSLNAAAYLLKPLNTDRLLQIVREEFSRQSVFSALQEHRRKQEEGQRLMQALETAFRQSTGSGANTALQSYITLTFDQVVDSLLDLKTMMEIAMAHSPNESLIEKLNASRPLVLITAIQDAIQVLDRTRNSFRSKELASLRQKLERLLDASAASRTGSSSGFQATTSSPPISVSPFDA